MLNGGLLAVSVEFINAILDLICAYLGEKLKNNNG